MSDKSVGRMVYNAVGRNIYEVLQANNGIELTEDQLRDVTGYLAASILRDLGEIGMLKTPDVGNDK